MIQGQKDVALSDTGIEQARLVAKRLAGEKFDLAFSSDLMRAKKVDGYWSDHASNMFALLSWL